MSPDKENRAQVKKYNTPQEESSLKLKAINGV